MQYQFANLPIRIKMIAMDDYQDFDDGTSRPKRSPDSKRLKVDQNVALQKFQTTMEEVYEEWNIAHPDLQIELPPKVYITDSAAESQLRVKGWDKRHYGGTSDIDVLIPEPEGWKPEDISRFENKLRNELDESGYDINFAPRDELENGKTERYAVPRSLEWRENVGKIQ
jgi:hypothetical protein